MTKEDQTQVTPSGNIPNNPNPDREKGIPFSIAIDGAKQVDTSNFVADDTFDGYSTIEEYNEYVREYNEELGDYAYDHRYLDEYDPETHENPEEILLSENDIASFDPVYYPDRYTDTLEKELKRDGRQCGGEDVSIDKTKNPEFHATGIVLDGNVEDFRKIRKHKGPVNLVTPLTDNAGGMEVMVKKGKIGEIVGWDAVYKQWQFKYTIDMVATGTDTDESGKNEIVSEIISEAE